MSCLVTCNQGGFSQTKTWQSRHRYGGNWKISPGSGRLQTDESADGEIDRQGVFAEAQQRSSTGLIGYSGRGPPRRSAYRFSHDRCQLRTSTTRRMTIVSRERAMRAIAFSVSPRSTSRNHPVEDISRPGWLTRRRWESLRFRGLCPGSPHARCSTHLGWASRSSSGRPRRFRRPKR
jgi:hypothetical protein